MKLFEPGKIGRLSTKNRIVMAPMGIGGLAEPDGRLSQRAIDYYAARAKGGTGLIISCSSRVSRKIEQLPIMPFVRNVTIDSRIYTSRLSEWADAVHDYGAKVAMQLSPGVGRIAAGEYLEGSGPVAPSPLPCFFDPSVMARELTTQEVEQAVRAFELAAKIVSTAGIDAIEIHGHGGYLIDEFTTSLWNKRTDKYGGDLEGRLRLVLEIIEAIRRGAGADFPIIYRYGPTHYLEGGREIEEGLEIARRLEAAGVAALDIDAGCYETMPWAQPPTTQPPGCLVDLAGMVKKVVSIPVMVVGKLGYPELAEKVLEEGKADFIVLGRSLLADPEWPNKVKERKLEDIRPCIGDNECWNRMSQSKYISCTVNPMTGMEREFAIKPAERKKSVLVIGGGPAGMEAARVAALRGHKVTLWEKGDVLGGSLIPASVPDFKQDYRRLINYLSTQVKKLGVTIELAKEATPELVQQMKPEVIFVATGRIPIVPEIPGIAKGKVVTAVDVLLGKRKAGESVVVVGGGLIGCETALHLAKQGKKLTIVEILDSVARDMYWINRMHLLELLAEANVEILTETKVLEITDEGIAIADKYGKRNALAADTVLLALGLSPNEKLLGTLKGKAPEMYTIGDCVEARKVIDAIWEGFRTARLV
ncbi:FAD-dependent oxidoreductase [Chloroflexota bacterium]